MAKIKFPRLAVFIAGLLMQIGFLAALDLAFRYYYSHTQSAELRYLWKSKGQAAPGKPYWAFPPGTAFNQQVVLNGQILAEGSVATDDKGRRLAPQAGSDRKEHALFMGGSVIFGDGLSDENTIPAAYASIDEKHHAYNYALSGGGPHQFLEKAESGLLGQENVPEEDGFLAYFYYDDYMNRVLDSARWVRTRSDFKAPNFQLDANGKLVKAGDFDSAHPWRTYIYGILGRSGIIRWLNLDFPLFYSDEDFALMAEIIAGTKEQYLKAHPRGRFVAILYPTKTGRTGKRLAPQLAKRGIELLDYSSLQSFPRTDAAYWIPAFDHPTGKMNLEFAKLILRDLQGPSSPKN